jgi:hypothetical protein
MTDCGGVIPPQGFVVRLKEMGEDADDEFWGKAEKRGGYAVLLPAELDLMEGSRVLFDVDYIQFVVFS